MIYSNSEDHRKEVETLKKLSGHIPELKGFVFRRNTEPLAIYDFAGKRGKEEACFDVKVRDIPHNKHNSYFVSVEKIEHISKHNGLHFIAYRFNTGVIRVFNLNTCRMYEGELSFFNRRAVKMETKTVYEIPIPEMSYEFYDTDYSGMSA